MQTINANDVVVNDNLVSPSDTIILYQTFCKEEAFVEPSGTTTKYQVSLLHFFALAINRSIKCGIHQSIPRAH